MNSRHGFTLIELLLASSIFVMVIVGVYGVFFQGLKLDARSTTNTEVYRQAKMALDLLACDIENMVPYDFSNSYKEEKAFKGSKNEIQFLAESKDGLKVIRYLLVRSEDSQRLITQMGIITKKNVRVDELVRAEQKSALLVREEIPLIEYLKGAPEISQNWEIISDRIKEDDSSFSFADKMVEGDFNFQTEGWDKKELPIAVRVKMAFTDMNSLRDEELTRDVWIPQGSVVVEELQEENEIQ